MTNNIINNIMNINDSTKENKTLEGQNISQEKQDNITNKDSNKKKNRFSICLWYIIFQWYIKIYNYNSKKINENRKL